MSNKRGPVTADALRQELLANVDRMDTLFHTLIQRNPGPDLMNNFINLALSAQNHCRRTVKTLKQIDATESKKRSNELLEGGS